MLSMFSPATPQVGESSPGPGLPWGDQPTSVGAGILGSPEQPQGTAHVGQSLTPSKTSGQLDLDVHELIKLGKLEELVSSFVFTQDSQHDELITEPQEVVDRTLKVSAAIQEELGKVLSTTRAKVVAHPVSYLKTSVDDTGRAI